MRQEKITVNGIEHKIFIHQEKRDNTRFSIGKRGINVRVPTGLSKEELFKVIFEAKQWAQKALQKRKIQPEDKGFKEYNNGDEISVGGDTYKLNITFTDKKGSSAQTYGKTVFLIISQNISEQEKKKHISVLLSRVIGKVKKEYIVDKVNALNKKYFGFEIGKIFLKYNSSNWGSCSQKNNINISTRLLFAPEEVIDYVCIHELAHIKEKNHSAKFWELVASAIPNYKERIKWLKENGKKCWY